MRDEAGFDSGSVRHAYFIGIGGIGMSAIARFFLSLGARVSGYDRYRSALTDRLEEEGMKIHYSIDPQAVPEDADLVIYTPAIPGDHAELVFLKEKGYRLYKRAEILGLLSQQMRCIAIAGTHGKTSSSILLSHLLKSSGIDITAFLGGVALNYQSNFLAGKSEWVVLEADEYDRSFLRLFPEIAVINSLDPDHLDIYGSEEKMQAAYFEFAGQIRPGGKLLVEVQALRKIPLQLMESLREKGVQVESFGLDAGESFAENIRQDELVIRFDFRRGGLVISDLEMNMAGRHNVQNATVAIAIALQLGVSEEDLRKALLSFEGIKRRFELIHRDDKRIIIDDYAHHPEELRSAIAAAKSHFKGRRITGVFQPHLYTRTRDFADQFGEVLSGLDEVVLVEIYPAREEPIEGINSEMLLKKIDSENKYYRNKSELIELLKKLDPGILLTLGAGDLDAMLPEIVNALKAK